MHGRRSRKAMLTQLRNNIIRKNRKVIRREARRGVRCCIKEATFWGRLKWLFGKGDLPDAVGGKSW